jgi:2-isopropylmalate synthase
MLKDPSKRYRPVTPVILPNRQWPSRQLTAPPVWCSTDLRDGNQALFEPMDRETKKRLFQVLVDVGLKEIEVGFPSASDTDFSTVRALIEEELVPDDVTLMVLTQAREALIERTVQSLVGARRAIVHIYNATAPVWRRVVFGMTTKEVMQLIDRQVRYLKSLTDRHPETEWVMEYSPETFSMTELEVSLEACNTAMAAWGVGAGRPVIINLPSTVENATPTCMRTSSSGCTRGSTRASTLRCRFIRITIAAPALLPRSLHSSPERSVLKVACLEMGSGRAMSISSRSR